MSAQDVIHHRITFAEDLATPLYETLMDGFVTSMRDENDIPGQSPFVPEDTGATAVADMTTALRMSEAFWVAPGMVELAIAASENMPDEPLLPMDLPSPLGFMWFGQPYRQIDIRRKALSMNAIMWSQRGGKVRLWHFTHRDDPLDSVNTVLRAQMGEEEWRKVPFLSVNHVMDLTFGDELPQAVSWSKPIPPSAAVSLRSSINPDGSLHVEMASDAPMDEAPKIIRSPLSAFVVTIWRLCQQTLADRDIVPLTRHQRRRFAKMNQPDTPVTVITLRRRHEASEEGESDVEWSHRWVVRGHWRKQPCKEDGVWTHRYVYINPYIKGPEDKPILIREHVNALYR